MNEYHERLEKEKEAEKKRLEEEKLANKNANVAGRTRRNFFSANFDVIHSILMIFCIFMFRC